MIFIAVMMLTINEFRHCATDAGGRRGKDFEFGMNQVAVAPLRTERAGLVRVRPAACDETHRGAIAPDEGVCVVAGVLGSPRPLFTPRRCPFCRRP